MDEIRDSFKKQAVLEDFAWVLKATIIAGISIALVRVNGGYRCETDTCCFFYFGDCGRGWGCGS
jgi:hypothetical protein